MLDRFCDLNEMENDPTAERNRDPADSENMNIDEDLNNVPENNEEEYDEDAFDEEFGPQEFSALNTQLDQLQSALDSLETRNDDIHSKLLELLRSSREIRQVMVEENSEKRSGSGATSTGADAEPVTESSREKVESSTSDNQNPSSSSRASEEMESDE